MNPWPDRFRSVLGRTESPVFRESRGGFDDVALATWAYERARELGRGLEWAPQ